MNPALEVLEQITPAFLLLPLLHSPELFAFTLAFIASMGTFLGGLIVVAIGSLLGVKGEITARTGNVIGIFQSFSAGVMLYMTFIDLIPESVLVIGRFDSLLYFFIGVSSFICIVAFFPEQDDEPIEKELTQRQTRSSSKKTKQSDDKQKANLLRASLFTYTGMLLHNLPEGLSVYLSALSNPRLGLQLALGIMLHNIPEGMAVAIPIWAATGSPLYVLWMTFLNGLAEPVGVIIGGYLLKDFLDESVLSRCLASVAGIMAFISIYELFPSAIKFSGRNIATGALFAGMFVCFGALESVEMLIGRH